MKSALLVIDVQNIYCMEDSDYYCDNWEAVVANINRLIAVFESQGLPIYVIKHQHKKDGSDAGRMFDFTGEDGDLEFVEGTEQAEFCEKLKHTENERVVIKTRYDAFANTDLDDMLKKDGVEKIVVTGFMTNFCCESTIRTAHSKDYYIDFISDATSTPGTDQFGPEQTIASSIATIESGFACVLTTEEVE